MVSLIAFKVSTTNVIEPLKFFVVKLNDLTTKKLTTCIFGGENKAETENLHFCPIIYIDANGNRVYVNSSESDFEEFVKYLIHYGAHNQKEVLLEIPDPGDLLHKMIIDQQTVRSWSEHRKELELNIGDINHLFNRQINDDSMQKMKNKQTYSFINVFNGWSPPSAKEMPLNKNFSESGLLNVKRVSQSEVMQFLRLGMNVLIPSEDSAHLLMTFSKLPGSGHNYFSWQEQNDGNYKCEEMKIPVTVGRQGITYYSMDGKTLTENFDALLKDTNDKPAQEVAGCSVQMTNSEQCTTKALFNLLTPLASPRKEGSHCIVPEKTNETQAETDCIGNKTVEPRTDILLQGQNMNETGVPQTEKSFILHGNTLYFDLLKEKLGMPPNSSRYNCVIFFKKSMIPAVDFRKWTLMPKYIPWELNCMIQNIEMICASSMYCIELKSKEKCGEFHCWFSLKEEGTDKDFEFKIEVVVNEKCSRFDPVYESLIEQNFLVRYQNNETVPESNDCLLGARKPQPPVVEVPGTGESPSESCKPTSPMENDALIKDAQPDQESAEGEICKEKSNDSIDNDSDSSISLSFEDLDLQDRSSDSFELVNIPPCFVTKAGDGMQESVKARVKRRRVSGVKGTVKPQPVLEPTPTSSTSHSKTNTRVHVNAQPAFKPAVIAKDSMNIETPNEPPINPFSEYLSPPTSIPKEAQPVNILPDKVFEMTSNVFKSVLNSVKQQSDEIQKSVEESISTAAAQFIRSPQSQTPTKNVRPSRASKSANAAAQFPGPSSKEKQKMKYVPREGVEDSYEGLSNEKKTQLRYLNDMGFTNDHHNVFLLTQYPNDLDKVVESLLNFSEDL